MTNPVQEVWDPDEWMSGGQKTRAAKFGAVNEGQSPVPGSVEGGVVISKKMIQQTVYNPADQTLHGKPKFYDSGKPMLQMVIRVQTNQRLDEDDDGIRAIYVKGQMKAVVQKALADVGAPNVEIGGELKVRFVEQVFEKGFKKNIFEAKFTRPAVVAADQWMDSPTPASAPPSGPAPATANLSTLNRVRAQNPQHQASLRNGFDNEEPPF